MLITRSPVYCGRETAYDEILNRSLPDLLRAVNLRSSGLVGVLMRCVVCGKVMETVQSPIVVKSGKRVLAPFHHHKRSNKRKDATMRADRVTIAPRSYNSRLRDGFTILDNENW